MKSFWQMFVLTRREQIVVVVVMILFVAGVLLKLRFS